MKNAFDKVYSLIETPLEESCAMDVVIMSLTFDVLVMLSLIPLIDFVLPILFSCSLEHCILSPYHNSRISIVNLDLGHVDTMFDMVHVNDVDVESLGTT